MFKQIFVILVSWGIVSKVFAGPSFLVLSGGLDPSQNHYSQYLQTNRLYQSLVENFKNSRVDVFFAAGNRPDKKPLIADVHRIIKKGDERLEVQLVGNIKNNRPATKDNFMEYVSKELKTKLKSDENFYLFVNDHGSPNYSLDKKGKDFSNNCINMWKFDVNLEKEKFEYANSFAEQCLSKNELKKVLNKLNVNKTIFVMGQCYSGGFHQMAIDFDKNGIPHLSGNGKICGFTSVTDDTTASGCTPDVDGPNYQGYERGFTEELTGVDVVDGNKIKKLSSSVEGAHRQATIGDLTKDIPLSTSDYYLLSWAKAIQFKKFTSKNPQFSKEDASIFINNENRFNLKSNDINYNSKVSFFYKMQQVFEEKYPEYKDLLQGDLDKLLEEELKVDAEIATNNKLFKSAKMISMDLTEILLKGWSQYVLEVKPPYLSSIDLATEMNVGTVAEEMGDDLVDSYLTFMTSIFMVTRPDVGKNISRYKSKRLDYSLAWAKKSLNQSSVELALKIDDLKIMLEEINQIGASLTKRKGHLRRIATYRQIIGAWNVLKKMNEKVALKELDSLLECEKTPF